MVKIILFVKNSGRLFSLTALIMALTAIGTNVRGQTTIWSEDFNSYVTDVTTGTGSPAALGVIWNSTGVLAVNPVTHRLEATNVGSGQDTWSTNSIPISGYSNVTISMIIGEIGTMENADFVHVSYQVDLNIPVQFANLKDDFTLATVVQSGLSGGNLFLDIDIANGTDETHYVDDIVVSGTPSCTPPVLSCPADITEDNVTGTCGASVSFAATTTAGTEPITIAYYLDYGGGGQTEITSPHSFPVGTATVTAVATNACGSDDCSFTLEVEDVEDPEITSCPVPEESYDTDAGLCTKTLKFEAEATDNCPGEEIAYYLDYEGDDEEEIGFPYDFPFGTTTVTVVASDQAGNTDECSFDVVVDHVTTVLEVMVDPVSQQYTDMVTLTATVTPWNCALVDCTADGEVEFTIGNQVMGTAGLVDGVAELDVQLCGDFNTDGTLGTFTVDAVYTPGDCDAYLGSEDDCELEIVPEEACAVYSGVYYASTGSVNSTTATVVLAATVVSDDDGNYCDITNAKVQFIVDGNILATVPVELLVGEIGDGPSIGTATYEWTNASVGTYDILVKVVGYYSNEDAEGDCDGNAIVTVGMPSSDFITGGGYVIMENSKGLCAGTSGLKNNFGFNVKYNKKMTNLQGHINTIVRRMEYNETTETDELHLYQVKGNVMSSLYVDGDCAVFTGKASIEDITDPDFPISIAGNCTMQFTMTDNGEPGNSDMISVTVWKSDGGMWFTTYWDDDDNKPAEQLLNGGNLVVHSAVEEETAGTIPNTPQGKKKSAETAGVMVQLNQLTAYPNPFSDRVRFEFVPAEAVQARIDMFDSSGRLVKTVLNKPVEAGVAYHAEFKPGGAATSFYIYRMTMGEYIQTGKLIYRK